MAYYSDRYSVFRVNKKDKEDQLTQFSRALRTLDIAAIHARSPQAKGRVERANKTLQDRLVKEMRLRGISDMAAGNAYLPEFMADFNRRFAVAPRNPEDAHRAVLHDARELDLILCEQHTRKLTKNLTIRFERREYQVTGRGKGYRLRGAEVTVCKGFDGSVTVLREGRALPGRLLAEGEEPIPVEDGKTVRGRVDAAKAEQRARPAYKPPPDHPWRRPFKPAAASAGVSPRCGFVDESCGPARALRGVWAAGGQRARPSGHRPGVPPRVAHRLPTLARLSPTTPQLQQQVLSSRKRERPEPQKRDISTLEKRGHFNFALTLIKAQCCPMLYERERGQRFQR